MAENSKIEWTWYQLPDGTWVEGVHLQSVDKAMQRIAVIGALTDQRSA
jgi:hypothetical protein